MEKWCLFLVLAVLSNQALGFTFKGINEADSDESRTEKNPEDIYDWNRLIRDGRPAKGGLWLGVYVFPLQQLPGQEQRPGETPGQNQGQNDVPSSTPSPNGNGSTTQSSSYQICISTSCSATPEYNPVCGTDGVTYPNPGSLGCAQACGKNVSLFRRSRCPNNIPLN